MKKINVALSGSGTNFPIFIGAIKRLEQAGYEIEEIAGTSGGSIIASTFASGYNNSKALEIVVKEILPTIKKLLQPSLYNLLIYFGLFKTSKLKKELNKYLVPQFKDSYIPLHVTTTNISNPKLPASKIFSSKSTANSSVFDATLASMSIPFLFPYVLIEGTKYVDGGWVKNIPSDIWKNSKTPVVALHLGSKTPTLKETPKYKLVTRLVQYISTLINIAIAANMQESLSDKNVIDIPLRGAGELINLEMTENEIDLMIGEGYLSVDKWLLNNVI